ncbi:MAG TPA: hypothetical protein VK427_03845, partial [Kofleriaceae bacterium]|nr:hypothetical protein [Kofleriaceae bacterium]
EIEGAPRIGETVLFHRPSGTLVCADFLFNVTEPANTITKVVLAAMGTGGRRLAQSRAWKLLRKDKAALRTSIERVLAWPIQRVAMCHGHPVEVDAAGIAAVLRV